jgi:hypothetical protein
MSLAPEVAICLDWTPYASIPRDVSLLQMCVLVQPFVVTIQWLRILDVLYIKRQNILSVMLPWCHTTNNQLAFFSSL